LQTKLFLLKFELELVNLFDKIKNIRVQKPAGVEAGAVEFPLHRDVASQLFDVGFKMQEGKIMFTCNQEVSE
jgi:hypothetical protein